MPCDNHGCQGDHFHDDCPFPFVCSGCGSPEHCWSDCPEICLVCGVKRHTARYCNAFRPRRSGNPSVMFPAYPKPWPYLMSYKRNLVEIDAGRSESFRLLPQSPPRTPSPIPVVNLPAARPTSNRLRPTAPSFYPRRAEDAPSMPVPMPAFPPYFQPAAPDFYAPQVGDAPSMSAPLPGFPHFQPVAAAAPPATLPPMPTDYPLSGDLHNMHPEVADAWTRAYWESGSERRDMGLDY